MQSAHGLIATLTITAPIFLLMVLGYLCVRCKYFPAEGIKGISAFVARVAVPVLIFKALAERDLGEVLNAPYLLAYSLGSLIPFFAVFLYAKWARQQDNTSAAFYGMGGSFSNSVMVGYPIIIALFGEMAIVPLALTLLVENLVMMPITLAIAESDKQKGQGLLSTLGRTLPSILKNPIIIGILLGVFASLVDLPIPAVGTRLMELLAATVTGAALFAIGGMLVGMRVGGLLPDLSAITFSKLFLHPLAMLLVFWLMPGVENNFAHVAVVLACSPTFGIYAVIGAQYGKGEFCAASMLPTTVLSFVSISLIVWLLQHWAVFS